tara:strand:+ start:154 stop:990 length:837 start_codon:yes stop_codon:yes gene_type:complete
VNKQSKETEERAVMDNTSNILLTNDDGINSPGLWAMAESLTEVGQVTVVVPDRDQSGTGASMTLLKPLSIEVVESRIKRVTETYTVGGTPADCVIMAAEHLHKGRIDLIVSGINQGANLGLDVFNSGTFGAALHGYFRGIDSIAISSKYVDDVIYGPAAIVGAGLANLLGKRNNEAPFLLNVNFPPREIEGIKGVELTTLGPKAYLENVEEVKSGRRTYFWLHHNKATGAPLEKGTDVWAINNEKVSITVIDPYLSTLNGYSRCEDFVNVAESSLGMN